MNRKRDQLRFGSGGLFDCLGQGNPVFSEKVRLTDLTKCEEDLFGIVAFEMEDRFVPRRPITHRTEGHAPAYQAVQ